ncbi:MULTISPECIES: AbrB/MazE/SpoVT family DNA-binding domain-containing protein [Pasteurellaceae]|uniref:AbrB/MazE/SpoVT family DNA-binding domain-containing protein n=1 Tax=Pasteurella atlantica TaxID=2827233 RepID=A0AAW8CKV1_9PAST|nr:AbrB/MazE/SpoVT family DNA-binding domain-containing protein [Pasteurella atlantica]MBR0572664.1 AbrB/MazE/SpoVT family DNA-binding domain-containing protein [Pasteurella atlantica]MDP8038609.1 AbrB/MazE/SpoVT family DNA-binding domain-containing protein [Pasteurella atlantica]MDP8040701.1 AbrB/MazE/SpoVT family DNA-binding domain-containing protein [Pasteurella atlantica]MDP8042836.1 AbrB/MazE/SpoVT family DNA-binding domain-containing protein [Pasteurella atlantica]MDP8044923.1 AbrB/MazE/
MQIQIKKWGNSAAIRLPQAFLAQLNLSNNDNLDIEISDNSLVLRPVNKVKYDLKTLLNEMPDGLPRVEGWDEMPSVGLEEL